MSYSGIILADRLLPRLQLLNEETVFSAFLWGNKCVHTPRSCMAQDTSEDTVRQHSFSFSWDQFPEVPTSSDSPKQSQAYPQSQTWAARHQGCKHGRGPISASQGTTHFLQVRRYLTQGCQHAPCFPITIETKHVHAKVRMGALGKMFQAKHSSDKIF